MDVSPKRRRRVPAFAAGVAVAVFLAMVLRFWHPVYRFTALFEMGAANSAAATTIARETPVYVQPRSAGYDGQYYALLATDPWLRNPELSTALDNASYRARRILPSALAWIAGGGHAVDALTVYSILNLVAWLVLALVLWRLLEVDDAHGWMAWAGVMFSAGALASVRLALTDLIAATLVAATLAAAERGRKRTALVCLAGAALSRETSLLAVAGLLKSPWLSWKNAVRLVLAVLPLTIWLAYVRYRLGPADQGWDNLALPFLGIAGKWRDTVALVVSGRDPLLACTTLLATISVSVQALFIALTSRLQERWWRVGAAYVILLLYLGASVWEGFPGAAFRVLLPLTLAFNVLAARSRASWAWLVAGNLSLVAGLMSFRDVPAHGNEMAAARHGGEACIARLGEGWYPTERARHVWNWTAHSGTIDLEAWPRNGAAFILHFSSRALGTDVVRVEQDGRVIAEFTVGPAKQPFTVPVHVIGGHAVITFVTAMKPVPENSTPGSRELAFALYDLQIVPVGK